MAGEQPWKDKGMKKDEWLAQEVAKAVGAGKPSNCETVDFSDPNRPPTCIEVDFPIIPINQIAAIEGNAGKPIYQMSKWWARRRSSVFRAMLLASAIKAPEDPSEAAKLVWDAYYGNHQKMGAFKHLKVADIFMGGGTTIVEGSRLGMQMYGNDLNPVAWFIVKNEMAQVDKEEVEALLADIEAEVKPQIMPFYTCDCPRGHKGKWTHIPTEETMGEDFDPLSLSPDERKEYRYEGPEIIYVFWAKHGPCQVTGCGHRTPIMSSPVMAVKTLTVKSWAHKCEECGCDYDVEAKDARMAPGIPLVVADTERPFAVATLKGPGKGPKSAVCPCCGHLEYFGGMGKGKNKKVELSLLVHPQWLQGEPGNDEDGRPYGGSADDPLEDTIRWNQARAAKCRLVEVRGKLPEKVTCPQTHITFNTENGSILRSGVFVCSQCGSAQKIVDSIGKTRTTAPLAMFSLQGYCRQCEEDGHLYGGRFFMPASDSSRVNAASNEWRQRCDSDLKDFWPRIEIPFGHMTHQRQPLPQHGYTNWWKMFNARQLFVLACLLKAINKALWQSENLGLFVLGAFQQFLRNENLFCFWHRSHDHFAPSLSNSNFHPKNGSIEVGALSPIGYGPWRSAVGVLQASLDWLTKPWEL